MQVPETLDDDYLNSGSTCKFDLPTEYVPCCGPKIQGDGQIAISNMNSDAVKNILPALKLEVRYYDIQDIVCIKNYVVNVLVIRTVVSFSLSQDKENNK